MQELYDRVNEVLRLPAGAVPLRASMGVEPQLALAKAGTTLEPNEIADVASALEGLYELREWFCADQTETKVSWPGGGGERVAYLEDMGELLKTIVLEHIFIPVGEQLSTYCIVRVCVYVAIVE